uniref:Uncharacterized protein n=1 Tax=Anguilla anguilla TaxID=7936 RepID=A0A0E9RYG1_ANGAN
MQFGMKMIVDILCGNIIIINHDKYPIWEQNVDTYPVWGGEPNEIV